jgi:hypothetical protein
MPARRFASRVAVATLPLALAACVSYPLLNTDGTSGTVDGAASVGTSDTGGGGSGAGTTNSNGSNQNANGAADLPTSPTGDVAQELCDKFIVISERDGSRALHVYALTGDGSFAGWSAGEDVGFDAESGALVNFNDDENVTAEIIGEYGGNTLFLSNNEIVLSITLQNGSLWLYALDDAEEVRQWRMSSDLITQVDVDATHAIIVNRTRCTSIAGSSQ